MTDKELLERAAKAAEIEIVWNVMIDRHNPVIAPKTQKERNWLGHEYTPWNPLKNDGDALRLAVRLELTIHQWPDEVCVCNLNGTIDESVARVGDIYAATRCAIVRAAAEIGRGIKND